MKTLKLRAELSGEIKVVRVDRWRKRVVLEVEGERVTLYEGDQTVLTLQSERGGPVTQYEDKP